MVGTAIKSPKPVVLLIEDDESQLEFLTEVLDRAGYECKCAGTCAGGRELFVEGRFGCAVIDLGLPDGNGQTLLEDFSKADPCVVHVVLTGDSSAETVIETMRAGAFDYLTKPIDATTLKATIARALSHHAVVRERAELVQLLLEERQQLKARVEEATADLRQYAKVCEVSNARLRTLLELAQLSAHYVSEETLMRRVFEKLSKHLPLRCVGLCDLTRGRLLSVFQDEAGAVAFVGTQGDTAQVGYDRLLAEAEPELVVQSWIERNTRVDTSGLSAFVYPQTLWDRSVCTVGFYLAPGFTVDEAEREFLGMCAHYLAFEWEQGNLLLHVAHHASLGNIAVELTRNFIQPLTAIQTAADLVDEAALAPEVKEGMLVIRENVDRCRRQTQEFRKLSFLREDSVETVRLDDYVEQALDMLSVAIQNRGVTIDRNFQSNSECVLLNGTALARTFLDLILDALRSVDVGGRIGLSLQDVGADHIAFEITHQARDRTAGVPGPSDGPVAAPFGVPLSANPGLLLAERSVHRCGGKLSLQRVDRDHSVLRILLPKNATDPNVARGMVR